MNNREMIWDASWTFNVPPKEDDTGTGKHIPQECDGKFRNNDILIAPSTNVGDRGGLGVEYGLFGISYGKFYIRHLPEISYFEASNQDLT